MIHGFAFLSQTMKEHTGSTNNCEKDIYLHSRDYSKTRIGTCIVRIYQVHTNSFPETKKKSPLSTAAKDPPSMNSSLYWLMIIVFWNPETASFPSSHKVVDWPTVVVQFQLLNSKVALSVTGMSGPPPASDNIPLPL